MLSLLRENRGAEGGSTGSRIEHRRASIVNNDEDT